MCCSSTKKEMDKQMKSAISYKGAIYTETEALKVASVKDFDLDDAQEQLDTIKEAMEKLERMFRRVGGTIYARWKAYPYGNIVSMLDNEHEYGHQTATIESCIKEVEDEQKDEEGEKDDDEE